MRNGIGRYLLLLAMATLLLVAGCGTHCKRQMAKCRNCQMHGAAMAAPMAADQAAERRDLLYVCNCGAECKCNSVSAKPGDCACGKSLAAYHVVKIEGDEALLCTCGKNCSCAIDPADGSKCGCGKPVKRVSLKGTGVYFCNCGGSCTCNTLSDQPGQCRCGMALKKVD